MTLFKRHTLVAVLLCAAAFVQAQSPGAEKRADGLNPFNGKYFSVEALEQERQSKALEAQIAQSKASIAQARVQELEATEKLRRGTTAAPVAIDTAATPAIKRIAEQPVAAKPSRPVVSPRKSNAVASQVAAPAMTVVSPPLAVAPAMVPSFDVARIRFADGREVRFQERGSEVAMVDRQGAPVRVERPAVIAVDTRPPQPPATNVPGGADATKAATLPTQPINQPPRATGSADRAVGTISDSLIAAPAVQ